MLSHFLLSLKRLTLLVFLQKFTNDVFFLGSWLQLKVDNRPAYLNGLLQVWLKSQSVPYQDQSAKFGMPVLDPEAVVFKHHCGMDSRHTDIVNT